MSDGVLAYSIPDEQKVTYRIVPSEGALLTLDLVGRQMSVLARLMVASCNADTPGTKWKCMIAGIRTDDRGAVEFDVLICPQLPAESA